MATMEEMIAKVVAKAVMGEIKKQLDPMKKQLNEIESRLEELKGVETVGGEKLLTLSEAQKRLRVNLAALNQLLASGEISEARTPGGRRKVLEKDSISHRKKAIFSSGR